MILIFDSKYDESGSNPLLKKTTTKLFEIKETLCLWNIWRIRNPYIRCFTFRQNYSFIVIERKLDFFLISNTSEEFVKKTDAVAPFCTTHSKIVFSLELKDMILWGKGLWKFNIWLTKIIQLTSNSDRNFKSKRFENLRFSFQKLLSKKQTKTENFYKQN